MHFPSKRDTSLSLLFAVSIIILLVFAFIIQSMLSLLFVGLAGFIGWIFWGTWYVLRDDSLLVRSGPFRWNIPYKDIASVRLTRNMFSAPASSLERLEITYGKGGYLLISPVDREEFARLLLARCPQASLKKPESSLF